MYIYQHIQLTNINKKNINLLCFDDSLAASFTRNKPINTLLTCESIVVEFETFTIDWFTGIAVYVESLFAFGTETCIVSEAVCLINCRVNAVIILKIISSNAT